MLEFEDDGVEEGSRSVLGVVLNDEDKEELGVLVGKEAAAAADRSGDSVSREEDVALFELAADTLTLTDGIAVRVDKADLVLDASAVDERVVPAERVAVGEAVAIALPVLSCDVPTVAVAIGVSELVPEAEVVNMAVIVPVAEPVVVVVAVTVKTAETVADIVGDAGDVKVAVALFVGVAVTLAETVEEAVGDFEA